MVQDIKNWWHNIQQATAAIWGAVWSNTIGQVIRAYQKLRPAFVQIRNFISGVWRDIERVTATIWDRIWAATIGSAIRGFQGLMKIIRSIGPSILTALKDAGTWLIHVGEDIIKGLFQGIVNQMLGVKNWINDHVVKPIIGAVKWFFGITSPSTAMIPIGVNLIKGVISGMLSEGKHLGGFVGKIFGGWSSALGAVVSKSLIDVAKLPKKALDALGSVLGKVGGFFSRLFGGGKPGGGVSQWSGTVLQALAMLHLPLSLLGQVLYQMQTESGGNPNAINLTDINARMGDPSRGLLQTIGSTFSAFHVPGTSMNIFDPLANVAAAINYALHTYGPTLMRGGMGIGSGHGYAGGTGGAAAGWAWVGENGPELVNFTGGEEVVPNGAPGYAIGARTMAQIHAEAIAHQQAAAATKMANAGASIAASLAKLTTSSTAASFGSAQTGFLKDLRLYLNPTTAAARSRLIISQINSMKSLETHIKTLSTSIANANANQKQIQASLIANTGIGHIGIQGVGAAGGVSILTGLRSQVRNLNLFGASIRDLARTGASTAVLQSVAMMDPASGTAYARNMTRALNRLHSIKAPQAIINQLVALGPDAANAYIDAMVAAGPAVEKQIFAAASALATTQAGVSRGVASVVAGGGYNTGVNFVAGLKSQQAALTREFKALGRTLGEEAIKWFRVPANKRPYGFQGGGWLNEPVYGYGMWSGNTYTFAEAGREYVVPEDAFRTRGGDGAVQYHAHFDGLTGAAIESHVQTAFQAMSLTQGALQRQGRRS
jgi:SLT domain-containing protein